MPTIHTLDVGGTLYDVKATHFAMCTTAATTAAKQAVIQNGSFTLEAGVQVSVMFASANSVANPTLNVNGTGAKPIYWGASGTVLPSTQYWVAGQTVNFIYNGTTWDVIGVIQDNDTTYSNATTSAAGLMSATDKRKVSYAPNSYSGVCSTAANTPAKIAQFCVNGTLASTGAVISTGAIATIFFTQETTVIPTTLNVGGSGAKPIKYRSGALSSSQCWNANTAITFMYYNNAWNIVDHNDYFRTSTSQDGQFLQVIDGIPTWSDLPTVEWGTWDS